MRTALARIAAALLWLTACSAPAPPPPSPLVQLQVFVDDRPVVPIDLPEREGGVQLRKLLQAEALPNWRSLRSLEVEAADGRKLTIRRRALEAGSRDLHFLRWEGSPSLVRFEAGKASPKDRPVLVEPTKLSLWTAPPVRSDEAPLPPRQPLRFVVDGQESPELDVAELQATPRSKEPGRADKQGSWHLHQLLGTRLEDLPVTKLVLEARDGSSLTLGATELGGGSLHFVHPNKKGTWTYKAYSAEQVEPQPGERVDPVHRLQDLLLVRVLTAQRSPVPADSD